MFIRSAQRVGLTLKEIRGIIEVRNCGVAPCSQVLALITEHLGEIDRRICDLQLMKAALNSLVREGAAIDPADCAPSSVCSILTNYSAESARTVARQVHTGRIDQP